MSTKCSRISSRSSPPARLSLCSVSNRWIEQLWPRCSIWRTSRKIVVCPPEPTLHGGTTQAIVIGPSASPECGSTATVRRG